MSTATPTVDLPVGIPRTEARVTPRAAARIAGVGYLLIFGLAIFANFVVREGLVTPGDPAGTAASITESIGLFRLGLVAFLAIFVIDVLIAWALHIVFREVNRDLSLVAAWSRLVYTVLLGVALVFSFQVITLLDAGGYAAVLGAEQREVQAMLALDAFDDAWLIGLFVFGLHLGILGALVLRSGYVSKVLGFLLLAAGAAYATDTVAHALLPGYDDVATLFLVAVAVPSMIGEGWLGLWLLLTRRFGR